MLMVQPANPIRVSVLDQAQRTPKLAFLSRASSPNGHQHTGRERHGVVGAGALITITDANDSSGLQGCETRYLGISSHCALSLPLDQEGVGQADLLLRRCSGEALILGLASQLVFFPILPTR